MTSLGGGQRVRKDSLRVTAYGWVDELNAALGVALAHGLSMRLAKIVPELQNELFRVGTDLAFVEDDREKYKKHNLPQIEARHVRRLEELIDEVNEIVGPLENFILPGGSIGAAHLHLAHHLPPCRARRHGSPQRKIGEYVLPYLNRLSDALFVIGATKTMSARGRAALGLHA